MAGEAGEIRAAIAEDRKDLADTVQALARKTDVTAQARDAVTHTSERLSRALASDDPRGALLGPVTGALRRHRRTVLIAGGLVLAYLIGRRRGARR